MATIDEQKQLSDLIKNKLQQFLTITIDELSRETQLGQQLSFKGGEQLFIKIIDLFKKVNSVDLNEIPYNMLNKFNGQLDQAISIFDQIKNFNPATNNPVGQRDSMLSQLENQYESYYSTAIPILTTGLLNTNDLSLERAKLNEALTELEKEKEKTKKDSERYLNEIIDVLSKARQAAVEVGVAHHNMIFKEEAEEHNRLSENWLKWTIRVLIAITIVGIGLLYVEPPDDGEHFLIHFTITKIVILTVMFYALAICTRNYKAHKHNSILNKHRQNALNTFETFSKAAGADTQTKNAVLLEATHTIFSNQQTGYLNNDGDSDSPNKIIEIIKNSTSKSQE
jgi:tetratricopeptide (TPR) repeat protein